MLRRHGLASLGGMGCRNHVWLPGLACRHLCQGKFATKLGESRECRVAAARIRSHSVAAGVVHTAKEHWNALARSSTGCRSCFELAVCQHARHSVCELHANVTPLAIASVFLTPRHKFRASTFRCAGGLLTPG